MQLTVKYESNVALHPAVRWRIETIIENLQRTKPNTTSWWQTLLGHPLVTSRVVERGESIAEYTAILSSNRTERASFGIYEIGIAEVTDDSQTWNVYYCQVSSQTVLKIDGLTFDEDVCEGQMPRSHVDLYWYPHHQRGRTLLGIVASGEILVPHFHFKPYESNSPRLRLPKVFRGRVSRLAQDVSSLGVIPAPEQEQEALQVICDLI